MPGAAATFSGRITYGVTVIRGVTVFRGGVVAAVAIAAVLGAPFYGRGMPLPCEHNALNASREDA